MSGQQQDERAVPCPHCGVELYDRVRWDDERQIPVCPDCRGDVRRGEDEES